MIIEVNILIIKWSSRKYHYHSLPSLLSAGVYKPWWRPYCESDSPCAKSESKIKLTKTLLKMSMAKMSSMKRCSMGKKIKLASSMLMEEGQSPWTLICEIIGSPLLPCSLVSMFRCFLVVVPFFPCSLFLVPCFLVFFSSHVRPQLMKVLWFSGSHGCNLWHHCLQRRLQTGSGDQVNHQSIGFVSISSF